MLERIDVGGTAEIFLARPTDAADRRELFVVKWLRRDAASRRNSSYSLIDESRIARSLIHRSICQMHGFGSQDDRLFVVMDYIHGKSLNRVLARAKKRQIGLPYWMTATVIAAVADALDYVHTKTSSHGNALKIIHRDISPQNIMLTYSGIPKLIDFGIAKAIGRVVVTAPGEVKGTSAYMAPEQALGMEIDARTDIYAAGIVLYELATGTRPYTGDSDQEILVAASRGKFTSPRKVNAELPKALAQIIERAMQRNPSKRYQRAAELSRDLRTFSGSVERPSKIDSTSHFMNLVFAQEKGREESRNRKLLDRLA
ncbi:MAG: serine/threonine-protein kinase [Myxococcota bacterium]